MMRNRANPEDLKPCPHMRTLVSAWIDGRIAGVARWYTEVHVQHCPKCRSSVVFLRGLRDRMRRLGGPDRAPADTLPEERWTALEAAWDRVDEKETDGTR